jgi:hypothetical protein
MIYLLRFCSEQPAWACSEQNLNKNHSRKIPATMIYFNFQCIEQTEEILNAFNLVIFHFLFDHLELDFSCSSEKKYSNKNTKIFTNWRSVRISIIFRQSSSQDFFLISRSFGPLITSIMAMFRLSLAGFMLKTSSKG